MQILNWQANRVDEKEQDRETAVQSKISNITISSNPDAWGGPLTNQPKSSVVFDDPGRRLFFLQIAPLNRLKKKKKHG